MTITTTTTPEEMGAYIKSNISSLSGLQIADMIYQYHQLKKLA